MRRSVWPPLPASPDFLIAIFPVFLLILPLYFLLFIYILTLASLGLRCCERAFLSYGEQRLLPTCSAWASYSCGSSFSETEHGLWCEGSGVVAQGLSYPATRGILVSQRGIKPVSPALAGRFLATGPPGKFRFFISLSLSFFFSPLCSFSHFHLCSFLSFYFLPLFFFPLHSYFYW